jgi:GNAT superfamily N-acetyltransferase
MNMEIILADYMNPSHARDLVYLLNDYAKDVMGGGKPLAPEVTDKLCGELARQGGAFSLICYVENKPAGLVNCLETFSTFNCKTVINIHDITVVEPFRGMGISKLLLQRVEELAMQRGACKLTLEVMDDNVIAKTTYRKFGFKDYTLENMSGPALFWEKKL